MMISKAMNDALNEQVTNEFTAAHKYLAMASCFHSRGLTVFGERFREQADEERDHAMKLVDYIQDAGGKIVVGAIAKPKTDYDTAHAIVAAALQSEETVTRQINDLMSLAEQEKDYATRSFLMWFVDEQVEEVASMTELLQWITLAGDNNLFLVESRIAEKLSKKVEE